MDKLAVQEYLTQGAVLAGQGKYEESLVYYEKAEHENPMEIDVYLSRGIALANLDRLEDAKEQFEKALKINRQSGLAYFHLGSIAILEGDIGKGFEQYNKAISYGYDDAQLYYSIGLLHEENGETDMAIRNYSKAIMRDALRPDIRIRKAQLLLQTGHMAEAMQALDEMILTNPDVFEGYHLKFTVLLQLRQYDKAEEVLDSAIGLFPKDLGFQMDKVALLIEEKKSREAMELLTALEQREEADDSFRRNVYMQRAHIYTLEDDITSAISSLEQAKELSGKAGEFDTEIFFLLTSCHLSLKEYDKVLEYARLLLEKAPEGYSKEVARYFEPFALKMLGRTEESIPLYQEAIREYRNQSLEAPGNMDAYLLRAMCLRDIEQYEKALELIDYVISLQSDRGEPRLVRITILDALGRNEEAEEEAKLVNAMMPKELRS